MAAVKRTSDQRDADRALIVDLLIKGLSQREIAAVINADEDRPYTITQQTAANDIRHIRKAWKEEYIGKHDEILGGQLAMLAKVKREALAEFERSKTNWSGKATKVKGTGGKEKTTVNEVEQTNREEGRLGDPRYLDVILKATDREAKLLGLDAPAKHDHSISTGDPFQVFIDMPADRRRAKIAELSARVGLEDEA
jgi:hypothetical protein